MKFIKVLILVSLFMSTSVEARSHHHGYDRGYRDGCDTARDGFIRDNYAFRHNPNYRDGWIDGKRECHRRPPMTNRRYDMGYQDGCRTARRGFTRDPILWAESKNYRRGWRDGTRRCR